MYKIAICVRNRLEMTKKCIEGIVRHSKLPHQIYIYDNLTNFREKEHFEFAYNLYKHGIITQYTFNTKESTFNAFPKVVALNQFGHLHQADPNKKSCEFILFIDNDMIVTPDFDVILQKAWAEVRKYMLKNIKIISQVPGGIIKRNPLKVKIAGFSCESGKAGGSGFWCVQSNFYDEVGFLPESKFVGINKRHDSSYWNLLNSSSRGQDYTLGLKHKFCIHCGKYSGSVCNVLTENKNKLNKEKMIFFDEQEKNIGNLSFEEFYKKIITDEKLMNDW